MHDEAEEGEDQAECEKYIRATDQDALGHMLQHQTTYSLFFSDWPHRKTIDRIADDAAAPLPPASSATLSVDRQASALMGFHLDRECPADLCQQLTAIVWIGETQLDPLPLHPGKIIFAFEGRCLIPCLTLRFSEVCVQLRGGHPDAISYCSVVGGHFNTDIVKTGRFFGMSCLRESAQQYCVYLGGLFGPIGTDTTRWSIPTAPPPPPADGLRSRKAKKKREWQAAIDRELTVATWHPMRPAFAAALYENEEGTTNTVEAAAAATATVLRLGEVMVVDNALSPAEVAQLAALADQVPHLGLHECPEALCLLRGALRRAKLAAIADAVCGPAATLGRSRERAIHQDGSLVGGELSVVAFLDNQPADSGHITFFPTFSFDVLAPPPPLPPPPLPPLPPPPNSPPTPSQRVLQLPLADNDDAVVAATAVAVSTSIAASITASIVLARKRKKMKEIWVEYRCRRRQKKKKAALPTPTPTPAITPPMPQTLPDEFVVRQDPPFSVASRQGRMVVFSVCLPHKVAAPQGVKRIAGCEAQWHPPPVVSYRREGKKAEAPIDAFSGGGGGS